MLAELSLQKKNEITSNINIIKGAKLPVKLLYEAPISVKPRAREQHLRSIHGLVSAEITPHAPREMHSTLLYSLREFNNNSHSARSTQSDSIASRSRIPSSLCLARGPILRAKVLRSHSPCSYENS